MVKESHWGERKHAVTATTHYANVHVVRLPPVKEQDPDRSRADNPEPLQNAMRQVRTQHENRTSPQLPN